MNDKLGEYLAESVNQLDSRNRYATDHLRTHIKM